MEMGTRRRDKIDNRLPECTGPKNRSQDISITLLVGHEKGLELIEKFQLVLM